MPGHIVSDVPGEIEAVFAPTEVCLRRLEDQLARYPFASAGKVRSVVSLNGMGTCSDRLLREAKALADRHRAPMIMHQSWDAGEVRAAWEQHRRRPIEHLADQGILGPNVALVHMIHLDEREVELVASTGASVVHCPAASMRRSMGAVRVGRFPELLEAGANVCLGSDGFSGKRDVARQAYLAAVAFREMRGEMPVITAETALEMATINGARALGLGEEVGSLEVGKRADLVIHRLDRPEVHPRLKDPVDGLVYFRQSATVDTVLVDGEAVLEGGRFTRFDAERAYAEIDAAAAGIEAYLGPTRFSAWPLVE
jgi:cytosine/adenosine deaminase-related metal-dependent hydrolase